MLRWLALTDIVGACLPIMELGRAGQIWPDADPHVSVPLALIGLPLFLFALIALSHQFIASHLTGQHQDGDRSVDAVPDEILPVDVNQVDPVGP